MKTKARKVLSLIIALIVAGLMTVGYIFAWLVDRLDSDLRIKGLSEGAYFDSGNGSEETPFVIANPTHMHNLAVLQNMGRFVDENGNPKKYYFEIKKTVDTINMSGTDYEYIPPIGNDKNPFIGDFNGNGKTIANFTVTTDKVKLETGFPLHAAADYEFSNAVGLFGMTGEDSNIHNVILETPKVEVASSNTKYSDGANTVVGFAVGHVAGMCQSVGVRTTSTTALDVKRKVTGDGKGYSTFNSILGELAGSVSSAVTGSAGAMGSGGSGAAFGASFDVESMLKRLNAIYKGKYGEDYHQGASDVPLENSSLKLPQISTQNKYPTPGDGAQIAFTADMDNSTYVGPDAEEKISDQNVGYFLGNQNKFNTKQLTFIDRMTDPDPNNRWLDWRTSNGVTSSKVPAWFYTYDDVISYNAGTTCQSAQGFRELTDAEFAELPVNIKKLLPDIGTQKTFTTVRISQGGVSSMNYGDLSNKAQWSYHGQISWMGKTYGKGFENANSQAVDENGNILPDDKENGEYYINNGGKTFELSYYTGGIALPNNAIWFKPSQTGKFRFIMYSEEDGNGFKLDKIVRTNANKENPFAVDPDEVGGDVKATTVIMQQLPTGILFYYDYNVTAEEIEAGNVEFLLQLNGNKGAHFIYLDIGASATDKVEDVSTIVDNSAVSAVDFIYAGVTIEQDAASELGVGNFIVNGARYNASKTIVFFKEVQTAITMAYIRLNPSNPEDDDSKTIQLNAGVMDDDIKNMRATYPNHVIPGGVTQQNIDGTFGGGTTNPGGETVAVSSVSISGAPSTLAVGETATLTASVSPSNATNKTVTWTSSDSNIASVDSNGKVTAKAAGEVTITATAGGKSASATITVTDGATQYHSGTYTLNAESTDSMVTNNGATKSGSSWTFGGNAQTVNLALNVQEGKVITISVKGRRNSPNAEGINVYLGESNSGTKLGTIDLTSTEGEGIGTVQYTATADGYVYLALGRSAAGGTILSEITVTISDGGSVTPTPTVSSVSVTPSTASVEVGKTTTLNASVTMSSGSYSGEITWTSSDTSVATVVDGVVTGVKAGTTTITATAGGVTSNEVTITVTGGANPDPTPSGTTYEFNSGNKNPTASTGAAITLNSGCTKQNGYIKLGKDSGSLQLTVNDVKAGSIVTIAVTAGNNSANTCKITITGDANLQANDDGTYTVIANGNITFTIETDGKDYYFGSATVTVTES